MFLLWKIKAGKSLTSLRHPAEQSLMLTCHESFFHIARLTQFSIQLCHIV